MKYQAVLFDVDNTLIDSADAISRALRIMVIQKKGIDISLNKFRNQIGQPGEVILDRLGIKNGDKIMRSYESFFKAELQHLRLFPKIREMILDLQNMGIIVGIVTSNNEKQFKLEIKRLPNIFDLPIVTTSDLTAKPKPSGDPLIYTIKTNGLDPSTTLYVGDSVYDMRAANEAKIDFAAAGWGALPDEKFENAKYLLKKPEDLLKLVSL